MFLWSRRGKSPAPVAGSREVAVQKVDKIKVVRRNLVTRPPIYDDGGRRYQRGGGRGGGVPRAPQGGDGSAAQGKDINQRSEEYIKRVRRMLFHSHKTAGPHQ